MPPFLIRGSKIVGSKGRLEMADKVHPIDSNKSAELNIKPRPGVRIYYNPHNEIVIRNYSDSHTGSLDEVCEDEQCCSYVRFAPEDADDVIRAIQAVKLELIG